MACMNHPYVGKYVLIFYAPQKFPLVCGKVGKTIIL